MSNEQIVVRIQAGENTADNMLKLWQQTESFIAKLAMSYQGYAELEDLKQEGYIGLCEAVRQYDSDKGVPFINYAAFWIRQVMRRYIDNCCSVVRLPVHVREWVAKYNRAVKEYRKEYGYYPSDRALCVLLDIGQKKLHSIQKSVRMGQIASLSQPVAGKDEDVILYEIVAADTDMEDDVIKALDTAEIKRVVWIAVEELPANLSEAVKKRYREGLTLKEAGKRMGIGADAVRQLESRAIRQLRHKKQHKKFRAYCEEYMPVSSIHHVGVESFRRTHMSAVELQVFGWEKLTDI